MKVLIITSIFPPEIGGPATFSYNLAGFLKKTSDNVVVITFGNADKKQPFLVKRIKLRENLFLGAFFRQAELFLTILKQASKIDVIFSQDALVVGFASVLAGRILKKPVVIKFVGDIVWENRNRNRNRELTLEGFYKNKRFKFSNRVKFQIQKWSLKNCNKVIVPAKYLKDFIVKNYSISSEKICIVYNGVKIIPIKKKAKKNRLITVARLVPWKNIGKIIQILTDLPKSTKYTIVGSGPELKKLKRLVHRSVLCNQVRLLGKLSNERTINEIARSSIFILNSSYEGLPHVLLEAALVKTAIVAPKLPGIREIFSEKEVAYFKPEDKKELETILKDLLKNPKKRKKLENRAYKKVKDNFSWKKTAEETHELLSGMI